VAKGSCRSVEGFPIVTALSRLSTCCRASAATHRPPASRCPSRASGVSVGSCPKSPAARGKRPLVPRRIIDAEIRVDDITLRCWRTWVSCAPSVRGTRSRCSSSGRPRAPARPVRRGRAARAVSRWPGTAAAWGGGVPPAGDPVRPVRPLGPAVRGPGERLRRDPVHPPPPAGREACGGAAIVRRDRRALESPDGPAIPTGGSPVIPYSVTFGGISGKYASWKEATFAVVPSRST